MAGNSIIVHMGLNTAAMTAGISKAKAAIGALESSLGALGFTAGTVGLSVIGSELTEMARRLNQLSITTGQGVEDIGALAAAFRQAGLDFDQSTDLLQEFALRAGEAQEGANGLAERFERYGIALEDSEGRLKTNSELLGDIADAMQKVEGQAQKAFILDEFFGGEGARLVQVFEEGREGLERLKNEAREAGQVMSAETVASVLDLANSIKGPLNTVLVKIAETVAFVVQQFRRLGTFFGTLFGNISLDDLNRPLELIKKLKDLDFGAAADAALQSEKERTDELKKQQDLSIRAKRFEDELTAKKREQLELERARTQEQKTRDEMDKRRAAFESARASLKGAKEDRVRFTLEELATGNPGGVASEKVRQDIFTAREVVRLEQQATFTRNRGDLEGAQDIFSRADQLRSGIESLVSRERNPFANLEKAMEESAKDLAEVRRMAAEKGLKIQATEVTP